MTVRPGNAQHQGTRDAQQDAFAFSDLDDRRFAGHGGVLAVLADGMGGLKLGGDASTAAVRAFLNRYVLKAPGEPIPHALNAALDEANRAVLGIARASGVDGAAGATLVAAAIHRGALHWIGVGDSRAYLVRNGQLTQITIDHNYAAELDRDRAIGRLSDDAAARNPQREALTSHLGKADLPLVDRSVRPLPLEPGDSVLLCSDGVYRALSPQELAGALTTDPQTACEALIERAIAKKLPNQDNATAVAFTLDRGAAAPIAPTAARPRRSRVEATVKLLILILAITGMWWRIHHDGLVRLPVEATHASPAAHAPAGESR